MHNFDQNSPLCPPSSCSAWVASLCHNLGLKKGQMVNTHFHETVHTKLGYYGGLEFSISVGTISSPGAGMSLGGWEPLSLGFTRSFETLTGKLRKKLHKNYLRKMIQPLRLLTDET